MGWLVGENKTTNVANVVGSLSKIRTWTPKDTHTLAKIELLLLERISLAGIARVMGVSQSWLQNYVNQLYGAIELKATVIPKEIGKHTVQMDELWYESRGQRE